MAYEGNIHRHPSAVFFTLGSQAEVPKHRHVDSPIHSHRVVHNFPQFPGYQPPTSGTSPYYCLPLFDVSLTVDVTSTIARSSLVQQFHNPADYTIPESTYSFPLYDGAVVSSFRCTIGDEKVLEGRIKPTAEAHAVFKEAVAKKQAAALLQEHTPEIFEVLLGSLPPQTTTKIEITYVHELKADIKAEGLLLIVPTSIAPRYGVAPIGQRFASSYPMEGGLKIVVNIDVPVPLYELASTTHPVSVQIGHAERKQVAGSFLDLASNLKVTSHDPKRGRATLNDRNAILGKDFVLRIIATDNLLLNSQALWQPALTPNQDRAMMITLNPREFLPQLSRSDKFEGEIILLADRSGSMECKIDRLKEALVIFLRGLPPGCYFNIVSFGSQHSALWPESQTCSHENLQTAMKHLQKNFRADLGGTEILAALEQSVMMRRRSGITSTEVVVLTDGEVWNTELVIQYVRQARKESENSIRCFALGIGDSVSHSLIEGISIAGGGFGEVVQMSENGAWDDCVVKLLEGVLLPSSWSCRIALDVKGTHNDENLSSATGIDGEADTTDTSAYIQAPYKTSGFHPYRRQSIFFLFKPTFEILPDQISIEVRTSSGATTTISIPVARARDDTQGVQILAAKAALFDLENAQSWVHCSSQQPMSSQALLETVTEEGERLGMTYGLTSRWTAFVATENLSNADNAARMYKADQLDLSLLTQSTCLPSQPKMFASKGRQFRQLQQRQCSRSSTLYQSNSIAPLSRYEGEVASLRLHSNSVVNDLRRAGNHAIPDLDCRAYSPSFETANKRSAQQGGSVTSISNWIANGNETLKVIRSGRDVQQGNSSELHGAVEELLKRNKDFASSISVQDSLDELFSKFPSDLANFVPELKDAMSKVNLESSNVADQWKRLILEPLSGLHQLSLPEKIVLLIDISDQHDESDVDTVLQLICQLATVVGATARILISSNDATLVAAAFRKYSGSNQQQHSLIHKDSHDPQQQKTFIISGRQVVILWNSRAQVSVTLSAAKESTSKFGSFLSGIWRFPPRFRSKDVDKGSEI